MTPSDVRYVVVHCAATRPSMDIGAAEIDQWHRQRGWSGIGYHAVIRRNGTIEPGRSIRFNDVQAGAHVAGLNDVSVGVCLVGGLGYVDGKDAQSFEEAYTPYQEHALLSLLDTWRRMFPKAEVVGHRDLASGKACPCFDVRSWLVDRDF